VLDTQHLVNSSLIPAEASLGDLDKFVDMLRKQVRQGTELLQLRWQQAGVGW
jgi:hypothetical protein